MNGKECLRGLSVGRRYSKNNVVHFFFFQISVYYNLRFLFVSIIIIIVILLYIS